MRGISLIRYAASLLIKVVSFDLNLQRIMSFDLGVGKDENRKHGQKSAARQDRDS